MVEVAGEKCGGRAVYSVTSISHDIVLLVTINVNPLLMADRLDAKVM